MAGGREPSQEVLKGGLPHRRNHEPKTTRLGCLRLAGLAALHEIRPRPPSGIFS
jgi:hypothetical protein